MSKADEKQIGGNHYKHLAIQPAEFNQRNRLPFLEGCVVKRMCRHRDKNGIEDLRKAMHEIELIAQFEYPDTPLDPKTPENAVQDVSGDTPVRRVALVLEGKLKGLYEIQGPDAVALNMAAFLADWYDLHGHDLNPADPDFLNRQGFWVSGDVYAEESDG